MFKKMTVAAAALSCIAAAPALAGSMTAPQPEPAIQAPIPVAPATPNWTGFYGGAELGYANLDPNSGSNENDVIGGLTAGYDYDLGNWVVGGALDYDFSSINFTSGGVGDSLDGVFRAKLRAGYKIGRGLLYGTGGYANADFNNASNRDGWVLGGGYEYLIRDNLSLGGEVLYHQFDNATTNGNDVNLTTVQARATFRF